MLKIKLSEERAKEAMDAPYTVNGVKKEHKSKSEALKNKKTKEHYKMINGEEVFIPYKKPNIVRVPKGAKDVTDDFARNYK